MSAAVVGTGGNDAGYTSPASPYVDGSNNVWFNMENSSAAISPTTNGIQSNYNADIGIGGFLAIGTATAALSGTSPTNFVAASAGNAVNQSAVGGWIVVDPNVSDFTTNSGTNTAIVGAPFLWTYGSNANASSDGTNLIQFFSQPTSANSTTTQGSQTPLSRLGVGPNLASGSTDSTTATLYGSKANFDIADIQNPATPGTPTASTDYLHFICSSTTTAVPAATDWAFDKAGNLWTANGTTAGITTITPINTSTTSVINVAISKMTPGYGSGTPRGWGTKLGTGSNYVTEDPNFTFSVYHNVAGMYDGSAVTNFVQFLTTDGNGNIWFSLVSSPYVNAITNAGAALSPPGVSPGTTAGFIGSVCSSCTFNGTTATFCEAERARHQPSGHRPGRQRVGSDRRPCGYQRRCRVHFGSGGHHHWWWLH